MIDKLKKDLCTACTSCASICPKQCITMVKDNEGFNYPIIDNSKCIECNLCEKLCPVLNELEVNRETNSYACINKDEKTRLESTSGGFFSILAEYVLDKNGYVCGAAYDEAFSVKHIIISNRKDLYKLRGAKYSQSELGIIFKEIKKLLDTDSYVLFSGTPCQVGGLKAYLQKEYNKLITTDLICHGVPSPMVWSKYIEYRASKDNDDKIPKSINLRSKISGWSRYGYSVVFDYDNNLYSNVNGNDLFMKIFVGDYVLRPSCSNCSFKGIHRVSDFTLGDYWGVWDQMPDMDDNKGTSIVFVHSDKGKTLLEKLSDKLVLKEVEPNRAIEQNPSMTRSSISKSNREQVFNLVKEGNFEKIKEMITVNTVVYKLSLLERIKSKLDKVIKNNNLY